MSIFSTTQLLRCLAFAAVILVAGIITVVAASVGNAHGLGIPEFMLFAVRLGWMTIASAIVWEVIAFIKLLLLLSEPTPPARRS